MNPVSSEEKIKRAALKEFSNHGFEGARIDIIARKARLNKAMIYYHFKSKEKLYESLLAEVCDMINNRVTGRTPGDQGPMEQLETIVNSIIDFQKGLDEDVVRMMLRELSSGGKYFKKLMLPMVIMPTLGIIQELFSVGIKQGVFKNVIPHLTFIQTLGSIIFVNAIRITLADTDMGKTIFKDDFFDQFKTNLLTILKQGILAN